MKTIFEHIERVKGKPHHIRRRIAFGAATAGTALIALVWIVGMAGSGAFALKDASFAQNTGGEGTLNIAGDNGQQNLAGATAAIQDANAPAHINIIDAASSTIQKKAERTVIPF